MKKLLFVASSVYYKGDGYRTRIDMEIEKLKDNYSVTLFLPEFKKNIDFPKDINVIKYPTSYEKKFHYIKNNISFFSVLNQLLKREKPIVIAESLIPAIKTYKLAKRNNCKFVFDCHGAEPSEFKLNNPGIKGSLLFFLLEWLESKVVNNSDLIVTVTKKQYDYFNIHKNYVVFPMMPKNDFLLEKSYRDEIRQKLGFRSDELVFVYSGQNQRWQMCEETCELFKSIKNVNSNARLLILTGCTDYFEKLLKEKGIENSVVMSVSHDEMPQYLDACDFGFCIRNSSIINQFASPTKVLEYVARNITPILSSYVGDFSETLLAEELALVIDGKSKLCLSRSNNNGREYVKKLNRQMVDDYRNAILSLEG